MCWAAITGGGSPAMNGKANLPLSLFAYTFPWKDERVTSLPLFGDLVRETEK